MIELVYIIVTTMFEIILYDCGNFCMKIATQIVNWVALCTIE